MIYNEKLGILLPPISSWWDRYDLEESEDLRAKTVFPIYREISERVLDEQISIKFEDVLDWKALRSPADVFMKPGLLAQFNLWRHNMLLDTLADKIVM
jgi:hypothetical protein